MFQDSIEGIDCRMWVYRNSNPWRVVLKRFTTAIDSQCYCSAGSEWTNNIRPNQTYAELLGNRDQSLLLTGWSTLLYFIGAGRAFTRKSHEMSPIFRQQSLAGLCSSKEVLLFDQTSFPSKFQKKSENVSYNWFYLSPVYLPPLSTFYRWSILPFYGGNYVHIVYYKYFILCALAVVGCRYWGRWAGFLFLYFMTVLWFSVDQKFSLHPPSPRIPQCSCRHGSVRLQTQFYDSTIIRAIQVTDGRWREMIGKI